MTLLRGDPLPSLLLVGMGRMGSALITGWRDRELLASYAVDPLASPAAALELSVVADAAHVPDHFAPQAVVFAIKPQLAADTLPHYARFAEGAVFLSVMAGPTLATLGRLLGPQAAIVRAMPNTPAAIRQGMSVAVAGAAVSDNQRDLCNALLECVGEVAWVENEALLDPVTAVSGGGPAYVFLLAELLEKAATEQGIPPDLARLMARQTVAGAGAMLIASEEEAASLRRGVTSPAGTTERALAVLMADNAWPALLSRAIAAATQRSRDLAD